MWPKPEVLPHQQKNRLWKPWKHSQIDFEHAEKICDEILISLLRADPYDVIKFKNEDISAKHIGLYHSCGYHFIVSNFTLMSDAVSDALIARPGSYSIMEHDLKYLRTRDPSVFKDFKAPSSQIINRILHFLFIYMSVYIRCGAAPYRGWLPK